MTLTPLPLSELPPVETYQPGDTVLIIRNGLFTRLNELPQGLQGEQGPPGENGESPAFRREGAFLQFKLPSDADWSNLVPLADIKGDSGDAIQLQVTSTHIQYRAVGDLDWINLIELSELEGPQGAQGIQGPIGPEGSSGSGGGGPLFIKTQDFLDLDVGNTADQSITSFLSGTFGTLTISASDLNSGFDYITRTLHLVQNSSITIRVNEAGSGFYIFNPLGNDRKTFNPDWAGFYELSLSGPGTLTMLAYYDPNDFYPVYEFHYTSAIVAENEDPGNDPFL